MVHQRRLWFDFSSGNSSLSTYYESFCTSEINKEKETNSDIFTSVTGLELVTRKICHILSANSPHKKSNSLDIFGKNVSKMDRLSLP